MHRGVIYVQNLLCLSSATRTYALTRTIVTLTLISCGHSVCACCWKGLPALCVGNPAYSAYSHKQADRHKGGRTEGGTDGGRKVSLLCGPSLQGSTRAGSPTFLLCPCSLTLKVHCVVTRRQLWDENLIAYWFWWLHKQNKHNRQNFLLFYCVDVGRSAIFLDSNSVLGPYYPWEVFSLYGNISNYYFWVCIVTLIF